MAESQEKEVYLNDHFDEYLEDLCSLVNQPSISNTGQGIEECVGLILDLLPAYGFDDTRVFETPNHPAIISHAYSEDDSDDNHPTLLLYGHYDVQPVTPEEWDSPPFEATIRAGFDGRERVYGRGVGDDKGQWFAHVCALNILRNTSELPLNITLLLEGEEEISSPNLRHVVSENVESLDADILYAADGTMDNSHRPELQMGSRGLLYVQIDAQGAKRDVHSGIGGSIMPHPAWELVNVLGTMKDRDGRIQIDGFYEDMRSPTDEEMDLLDDIPFAEADIKKELELKGFNTEPGNTPVEQIYYRPTVNIAGLNSGYQGEGSKTVTPCKAQAKIDMRLFVNQDPDDIFHKFKNHVHEKGSELVEFEVKHLGSMKPVRTPLSIPEKDAILEALEDVWDRDPILKPSTPGSIPWYIFEEEMGIHCTKVPYANPDQRNHAPNENIALENFKNGIGISRRIFENLPDYIKL